MKRRKKKRKQKTQTKQNSNPTPWFLFCQQNQRKPTPEHKEFNRQCQEMKTCSSQCHWNPGVEMKVLKLDILVISHAKPTKSLKINTHQWSRSWIKATAKVSPGDVLQKSAVGRGAGSVQRLLTPPQEHLSVVPTLRLRSWASYKIILVEVSWPFHLPFPTPTFYGPFCPLPRALLLPYHLLWLLPDSKAEVFSLLSRSTWGSSPTFLTAPPL